LDDFLTGQLQPNARPAAYPYDYKVIINAGESAPYDAQENVGKQGKFWIKGQPYSIKFMLADDALTDQFVKDTVYQASLSVF